MPDGPVLRGATTSLSNQRRLSHGMFLSASVIFYQFTNLVQEAKLLLEAIPKVDKKVFKAMEQVDQLKESVGYIIDETKTWQS